MSFLDVVGLAYILGLWLCGVSAFRWRRWWLATMLMTAAGQSTFLAYGHPENAQWLSNAWIPGEALSLLAAAALVIASVARESGPLPAFRRLSLRVGSVAIGVSIAGLVWITARHETAYWIFTTHRAKFWLASAVALAVVTVFVPHPISRETKFTFMMAMAHALTAPLPGRAQPVFRIAMILLCLWWLLGPLASRGYPGASPEWKCWRYRPLSLLRRQSRA